MEVTYKIVAEVYGETVSSTALELSDFTGIDSDDVADSDVLIISVEDAAVRYTHGTSDPTASVGEPIESGNREIIHGQRLISGFKVIRQSGDATVNIRLLKR